MNRSDSIAKLASALVKAQAKMKPIGFDATNPFLKTQYATLGAMIDGTRPILEEFGLAVTQLPVSAPNQIGVTSILLHESGEYIESSIALNINSEKGKSLAQEAGSIITYLRRYSLAAILGIYADEDTDGVKNEVVKAVQEAVEQEDVLWSLDAIQLVMEKLPELASTREDAEMVLDLSDLPVDATPKTIGSWLKHIQSHESLGLMDAAREANKAYKAALRKTKK